RPQLGLALRLEIRPQLRATATNQTSQLVGDRAPALDHVNKIVAQTTRLADPLVEAPTKIIGGATQIADSGLGALRYAGEVTDQVLEFLAIAAYRAEATIEDHGI